MRRQISDEEIAQIGTPRQLVLLITDQQFEYWYDPCGRSGHDLDPCLTPVSEKLLHRLKTACVLEAVDPSRITPKLINHSNSLPFLIACFVASCPDSGHMPRVARYAIERLKDFLWHGTIVTEITALDEIVDSLNESSQ
ncbi:MAG: hypothetical protein AB7L09_01425 [Nitrospira sp.]